MSETCSAGALLVSQARTIASEHFSGSLQSSQCSGVSGVPVVCEWNFPKAEVSGVSVVSVDPWHTEKQDKRDRTINLEAAMQMTVTWQSQT